MEIAVIGAGIAGELAVYEALNAGHCVRVYDPQHPEGGASWNSTAIVGTFGTRKGVGPLGDLLLEAFHIAEEFYSLFQHPSVIQAPLQYWGLSGDKSFQERFAHLSKGRPRNEFICFKEQGFLLNAPAFMEELRRRNDLSPQCIRFKQYLTSWIDLPLSCQGVLYTPGATGSLVSLDGRQTRRRRGTFLQWEEQGDRVFFPESFHHNFYKKAMISYRSSSPQQGEGKLLMGSANGERGEILSLYENMKSLSFFPLPSLQKAKVFSGVRELSQDRLPQMTTLGEHRYALSGLYKNGYTLAPFFAKKFTKLLLSK